MSFQDVVIHIARNSFACIRILAAFLRTCMRSVVGAMAANDSPPSHTTQTLAELVQRLAERFETASEEERMAAQRVAQETGIFGRILIAGARGAAAQYSLLGTGSLPAPPSNDTDGVKGRYFRHEIARHPIRETLTDGTRHRAIDSMFMGMCAFKPDSEEWCLLPLDHSGMETGAPMSRRVMSGQNKKETVPVAARHDKGFLETAVLKATNLIRRADQAGARIIETLRSVKNGVGKTSRAYRRLPIAPPNTGRGARGAYRINSHEMGIYLLLVELTWPAPDGTDKTTYQVYVGQAGDIKSGFQARWLRPTATQSHCGSALTLAQNNGDGRSKLEDCALARNYCVEHTWEGNALVLVLATYDDTATPGLRERDFVRYFNATSTAVGMNIDLGQDSQIKSRRVAEGKSLGDDTTTAAAATDDSDDGEPLTPAPSAPKTTRARRAKSSKP